MSQSLRFCYTFSSSAGKTKSDLPDALQKSIQVALCQIPDPNSRRIPFPYYVLQIRTKGLLWTRTCARRSMCSTPNRSQIPPTVCGGPPNPQCSSKSGRAGRRLLLRFGYPPPTAGAVGSKAPTHLSTPNTFRSAPLASDHSGCRWRRRFE